MAAEVGSRLTLGYCGIWFALGDVCIGICDDSSGTEGGTFALPLKSRRTRGGLELRNEFDRATFDVFGKTIPLAGTAVAVLPLTVDFIDIVSSIWPALLKCGRTIVFRSNISVCVISDGSTNGSGRFVDFRI